MLLIERADKPGFWQSVTGSKDAPDEPLRRRPACARSRKKPASSSAAPRCRERRCATGRLRNVYEIYPVWRHRYAPGVTHNTEHVFGLTVPAGTPVRLNPREHLHYAWWPWREAADRCFSPSNAEAILQLPRFLPAEPR